jgi:hypothetical protein
VGPSILPHFFQRIPCDNDKISELSHQSLPFLELVLMEIIQCSCMFTSGIPVWITYNLQWLESLFICDDSNVKISLGEWMTRIKSFGIPIIYIQHMIRLKHGI